MVRTKWMLVLGIALLGCVNAFFVGEKVLNVRRVRRRKLMSPSREGDRSVIAAIVAANKSNNTKHQTVPSLRVSREMPAKAHAPRRKARLFR